MDLVKVKNFPDRMYAERARQTLDVEGIPSIIQSVDAGVLGAGGALGLPQGADLYVPGEFVDRARELLNDVFDGI
ncbi:MAG TPA: DUF2007 domain-containing protein [Bacteroidota bacterium]|nr:DUF2007 domain-containing protein [Bacteroidota bacterium]